MTRKQILNNLRKHGIKMGWLKPDTKDIKECPTCGALTEDRPTPDGDCICPNCGDLEMMDYEPKTHDQGCDIQRDNPCTCEQIKKSEEERKERLEEIPF